MNIRYLVKHGSHPVIRFIIVAQYLTLFLLSIIGIYTTNHNGLSHIEFMGLYGLLSIICYIANHYFDKQEWTLKDLVMNYRYMRGL